MAATRPRTLFVSVFHPEIVRGGAQQAAYELFQGFRREGRDALFLASVEPGNAPALFKPGAIVSGFDQRPGEYLFLSDSFEHAWYRNLNARAIRWFAEFLRETKPDVVHFHHFMTIGLDLFLVAKQALPEARMVMTLHEMLAICKANGHMVRRTDKTLCTRASPVRCNQCFPEVAPEMMQLREDWIRQCLGGLGPVVPPPPGRQRGGGGGRRARDARRGRPALQRRRRALAHGNAAPGGDGGAAARAARRQLAGRAAGGGHRRGALGRLPSGRAVGDGGVIADRRRPQGGRVLDLDEPATGVNRNERHPVPTQPGPAGPMARSGGSKDRRSGKSAMTF